MRKAFRLELRDLWVFASFVARNVGGIITFVSKKLVPLSTDISDLVISPGRVHRINIQKHNSTMTIFNVHNFELHPEETAHLCRALQADANASALDPMNFTTFALGDFNLKTSRIFSYQRPESVAQPGDRLSGDVRLRAALRRFTELDSGLPTRYSSRDDTARILDIIFTSLPAALIPVSRWTMTIPYDPKELARSGLSDHVPVIATIAFREPQSEELPIPAELFRHWTYSVFFRQMYYPKLFYFQER